MSKLADLLLDWYALNARKLPWRGQSDPYAIWISEIMLQQTRVDTVFPYFEKWMKKFPTVFDLAHSSESDVLSIWEGLGYYSRARNLRYAAQKIIKEHSGKLPSKLMDLINLPGIGRYTAGAIASIAFKADVTTVDGNIRRVFARLFDIQESVDSLSGKKILWGLLDTELPKGRAGEFNQALMDLGATLCTPKIPDCEQCPLQDICLARSQGNQTERPILKAKLIQPQFTYVGAIIQKEDSFLLTQRPSRGLLGGLWDFPNDRVSADEIDLEKNLTNFVTENLGQEIQILGKQGVFKHAYTHFRLNLHVYNCKWIAVNNLMPEMSYWIQRKELLNYPMGKVARQISTMLMVDDE